MLTYFKFEIWFIALDFSRENLYPWTEPALRALCVNACPDESVPIVALKFDVCVILLEGEIECFAEVDVRSFDGVHVIAGHLKLVEVKVLWENFH